MWQIDHRGRWDGFGYYGLGVVDDVLWVLLLLGLLALVLVLIARLLRSPANGKAGPDRALEIARERYAKGEISQSEYETLKKNLGG
ncbi:MAG: SHOCT domain-containing protein [Meiothermus sp.]|uniref:SHOCT domain-containing protein n=1 Tax=Meiothermus sp. TaxID=1955249 RepID=UPI0025E9E67B|nr:SHOCT domain-containing protein [Meiothermus sp.]MCS7067976.1 SHOCT domain-containing protein [Meiothermus sp.]MCX7600844.1 SHOCT domain-containing protein [Meiothermus sp.]MDW8426907.1 SHOCT domain-containing protein [Meiothermus sp.]